MKVGTEVFLVFHIYHRNDNRMLESLVAHMSPLEARRSVLKYLENRDLAGITFIRDYIQFLFDGPVLSAYSLPRVVTTEEIFVPEAPGYRDALCELIGKSVVATGEEPDSRISMQFVNGTRLEISLRDEDRVGAEAAMLQTGSPDDWNVW